MMRHMQEYIFTLLSDSMSVRAQLEQHLSGRSCEWEERKGPESLGNRTHCTLSIEIQEEAVVGVEEVLSHAGIDFSTRRWTDWTRAELAAAPWHRLIIDRAPTGVVIPDSDSIVESRSCMHCTSGARFRRRVYVEGISVLRGDFVRTPEGPLLLRDPIRAEIAKAGLNGVLFTPVFDAGSRDRLSDMWAIDAEHIAPHMHQDAIERFNREDECPKCGRDGWFDRRNWDASFVYRIGALDPSVDIYATWEEFGSSRQRSDQYRPFSRPGYVVSQRAYQLLGVQLRVRRLRFWPVELH